MVEVPDESRMRPVSAVWTVGLPISTRVWKNRTGNGARFGTVMPHQPEFSRGCFPVRFDDGIWETCDSSDVTAVPEQEQQAATVTTVARLSTSGTARAV